MSSDLVSRDFVSRWTLRAAGAARWVHALAVLTVLLAVPLLFLGAEVTGKGVGMVDPDGFSHVHDPLVLPKQWLQGVLAERGLGYLIEHGHRFFGILVGLSTILLTLALWLAEPRRWLRWLGAAALAAVVAQGVLGIFRVHLHALLGPHLALIHGCTAHLVFALLLSVAVFTSRFGSLPAEGAARPALLRRLAVGCAVLVYVQLVLGALVRHDTWPVAARAHQLAAFLVLAAAAWLLRETFTARGASRREVVLGCVLGTLLLVQVTLGIESWLSRFPPADPIRSRQAEPFFGTDSLVRSLHYLTGTLIFVASLVLALWVNRPARRATVLLAPPEPLREQEGVA